MLELKKNYKKNLKSIFFSKFCFRYSKSIFKALKISCYLVINKKKKNKINFFFIILVLIFGKLPKILTTKSKLKRIKKNEFLAFEYSANFFEIFKFINMYLPLSDIVENLYFKFNSQEYRLTIKYFPIINEIDKLCVLNTNLIEFISDYKLILNFKINL